VVKKSFIIPFSITLIFSTFSPITIHSANAATVGTGPCISTVSSDTGVTATTSDNYCVVSFKSTAATTTWTVPSGIYFVDVLVVAGGGAGGTANGGAGGGGGGGQVSVQSNKSVSGVVTIQVGSGGSPGSNSNTRGNDGGQSAFVLSASDSITARGGSAGASVAAALNVGTPSSNGFNGGGGSTWADSKTAGSTGVGGYSGGNANSDSITADNQAAGGGGGSGGVGVNATPANGGAGGAGTANSFTGTSVTYGGGGGGAKRTSSAGSAGTASGGGGAGGKSTVGSNGGTNTGGGGGGGGEANGVGALVGSSGGSGGSGIVVVKYLPITITTITNKLSSRNSTTASATVSSGSLSYSASGACSVIPSTGAVTFTSTGSCTITATASSSPSTTASTTFEIVPNLTQRIISRTGLQPNSLSSFIPPPYITTARAENVYACLAIVGSTGATVLTSTNLNISLFILSSATMSTADAGKSYTITGTLPQVQAAISTLKINSTSGRIMAANSGSIYLRVRANLIADATTDAQCLDLGNDGRIQLYQYTSDQIRRKNVPQRSGSTP
jgi:hypothetical protein